MQFKECIREDMRETRKKPVEWLLLYIPDRDDEIHNRGNGNGFEEAWIDFRDIQDN